jgi:hypothetical protein
MYRSQGFLTPTEMAAAVAETDMAASLERTRQLYGKAFPILYKRVGQPADALVDFPLGSICPRRWLLQISGNRFQNDQGAVERTTKVANVAYSARSKGHREQVSSSHFFSKSLRRISA